MSYRNYKLFWWSSNNLITWGSIFKTLLSKGTGCGRDLLHISDKTRMSRIHRTCKDGVLHKSMQVISRCFYHSGNSKMSCLNCIMVCNSSEVEGDLRVQMSVAILLLFSPGHSYTFQWHKTTKNKFWHMEQPTVQSFREVSDQCNK